MAEPRISHIELDEATILWRNADIEQERRIAIFDLIEENLFKPERSFAAGHHGPYHLRLSISTAPRKAASASTLAGSERTAGSAGRVRRTVSGMNGG